MVVFPKSGHIYAHTHIQTYTHAIYTLAHTPTDTYIHRHTDTHEQTHTNVHTHTHTRLQIPLISRGESCGLDSKNFSWI